MPGSVSDQSKGPSDSSPYVPSWCYDPPGPRMCKCGHREGYHNDEMQCNQRHKCECEGAHFVTPASGGAES
jgi:hypothetical protein